MVKKVGTSNKITITCLCKKCNPRCRCRCCKNKVKSLQYCHLTRRDSANEDKVEWGKDISIVTKNEIGENNPHAGPHMPILPCSLSSKPTKRRQVNITSTQKQGKFDAETMAEVEDALTTNERGPITLLYYALTAPLVFRLDVL